jgi:penicillin-binding protein 1A
MAGVAGFGVVVVLAGGGAGYIAWRRLTADLPSVDGLKSYQPPVMSRIYAGNGQLIAELASERRIYVPYSAIPDRLQAAFIAAEDQNFWTNPGIDPLAIIRAGVWDLMHMDSGRRPLGASTITQQVAKNMLLGSRMDLHRKIEEAILALRMQSVLSKPKILEIYLNEIYLGQGAYGVAAAAQTYFNKPLDRLTLAEDAMLAALPKAPSNYNPFRHPESAKERRDWVLDRMADIGAIPRAQVDGAKLQPLVAVEFQKPAAIPGANWMAEDVRQQLIAQFGENMANEGGLTVQTSLDTRLQTYADEAVRNGLMAYDRKMGGWRGPVTNLQVPNLAQDWPTELAKIDRPEGMLSNWQLGVILSTSATEARVGWLEPGSGASAPPVRHTGVIRLGGEVWHHPMTPDGDEGPAYQSLAEMVQPGDVVMIQPGPRSLALRQIPKVQGALVSLDPTTGRVLAIVGGWSYDASQFNRATQAQRQPGSSFKPFVYLTAMEKGLTPSDKFLNAPIVVDLGAQGVWRPHNYEENFGGPTTLRVALERSLNLVTLRVARRIGMKPIVATAKAFGLVDGMPAVLPAALGAVDTTVLKEAGAYATLDEGGRLVVPTMIESVQDREGHVVWRPPGLDCGGCSNPASPPDLAQSGTQVADPQSVFQIVNMMEGVIQHGTGVPAGAGINRPLAGKTGTTQDWQDAWFSGFTPDLVTVVWVGFDSPTTLGNGEQGAAVAAPIWHDFMAKALQGRPVLNFPQPDGVTMAQWNDGERTVTDAFKPGQTPGASSPVDGGILAEDGGAGPGGQPVPASGNTGSVDSSLGGLY